MTSITRLKRDISWIGEQLKKLPPENRIDVDWNRVPKEHKEKMMEASEIARKWKKEGQITLSERAALVEGEKLFLQYLEPVCILRKEKRGRWRPIH